MCFIALIRVKLGSKIASGFSSSYERKEYCFAVPATSVSSGDRGFKNVLIPGGGGNSLFFFCFHEDYD